MTDQVSHSDNKSEAINDEIDLIAMLKTVWKERMTIIKAMIICTIVGLIIALFSKEEYKATAIMVPQINNSASQLGGLSSLASLAGFNLDINTGSGDISPMLYPKIVGSKTFQLEIMNAKYVFKEVEEPVSLYDYYEDYYKPRLFEILKTYTIGLPDIIRSAISGKNEENLIGDSTGIINLSKKQDDVRKIIEEHINLSVNDKDGYLTINSRFHQAYLSAQIAEKVKELLQEYITRFKIEKARTQLEFIEKRYLEKKFEFEDAQSRLATFRDANKNISSSLLETREENLQNEYQLAFDVYSELAKQLEQSRIQVKEDTPVFTVIEEVSIPLERVKPKRSLIVIIWFLLGGMIGIFVILGRQFLATNKHRWNE